MYQAIHSGSEYMTDSDSRRRNVGNVKKPGLRVQDVAGEALAAEFNRQRNARNLIVQALARLGRPGKEWPDFVRSFATDPFEQTEYHQTGLPEPFQPPE